MYDDWLIFFTLDLFCRVGGKESCPWHNAWHACVHDKCECFLGTVYLNVSAQTGSFLAYVTKSRNLSYNRTRQTSFKVGYMHMLILLKLYLRHEQTTIRSYFMKMMWSDYSSCSSRVLCQDFSFGTLTNKFVLVVNLSLAAASDFLFHKDKNSR